MLLIVLRKMQANKWMVLCLLLGTVLAVGMVSSIPLYTEGVLNRMLRLDLEQFQRDTNIYPGRYSIKVNLESLYTESSQTEAFRFFDNYMHESVYSELRLPVMTEAKQKTSAAMETTMKKTPQNPEGKGITRFFTIPGFENHVTIETGTYPLDAVYDENGRLIVEAMISREMLVRDGYEVGVDYPAIALNKKMGGVVFRIKGIYIQNSGDPFWYDMNSSMNEYMIVGPNAFDALAFGKPELPFISSVEWYYALDYHAISIENLSHVLETFRLHAKKVEGFGSGGLRIPAMTILEGYETRETELRLMLTVLQVPILLMLAFYIFMVAQLIVEFERNEISVLKSRGASRRQIIYSYMIESVIIGGIALVLGPALGWFICSVLGASNGFLEFVSRTKLPMALSVNTFKYALAAVFFTGVMMLIPAIIQSKRDILEQKLSRSKPKAPIWKKFFLDIILLGVSFYGLYSYQMRQETLAATPVSGSAVPVDPLLFMISTLFIMGAGLLFLRIYPYILKLVFAAGRRFWSPQLYASFITVSRSGGQEQFLMIFLVLTLSLGIFNANAARTINLNVEEKLVYQAGADIAAVPVWMSNQRAPDSEEGPVSSFAPSVNTMDAGYGDDRIVTYIEPSFEPWENLEGVENVAKVYVNDRVSLTVAGTSNAVTRIMAIEPSKFAKVAFMPDGLLRPHWYNYLNLMSYEPAACLVTRSYQDQYHIKPGDTIKISWARQAPLELRVYGVVDYWPTFNPYDKTKGDKMVVCNLDFVRAKLAVEPYQTWIKRAQGATSQDVYNAIEASELRVTELIDSRQQLVRVKNDPILQGANGAMTMGFIVTMLVSSIGFIIYWILSIKGRVLQFGILRAMGLSLPKLVGMLFSEQIMISVVSIFMGVLLGGIAAKVFVPMLQMVYSAQQQVPPFRVVASPDDYIKIYIIIGAMLVVGFTILGVLLSRIRVAQALKLGED